MTSRAVGIAELAVIFSTGIALIVLALLNDSETAVIPRVYYYLLWVLMGTALFIRPIWLAVNRKNYSEAVTATVDTSRLEIYGHRGRWRITRLKYKRETYTLTGVMFFIPIPGKNCDIAFHKSDRKRIILPSAALINAVVFAAAGIIWETAFAVYIANNFKQLI